MINDMHKNELTETEMENIVGGMENVTADAASQDKYYTVQKGDSLSAIASKYNTSVIKLIFLNPHIKDPNLIYPGDVIRLHL